jgi:hypothetical protein
VELWVFGYGLNRIKTGNFQEQQTEDGCQSCEKRLPKRLSAMKNYRILPGIWLILIISTSVSAFDLHQGMHGMPWASSASQYSHLTKVRESNLVDYYINSKMIYQVVNQSVTDVFYGFYKNEFFAVYIKLRSREQFDHLKLLFSENYGKPKVEQNAAGQHVVYRWKDGDVKIKVKMKEAVGDIKLAVYYMPISAVLNEELLEQTKLDTFDPAASNKDKSVKAAPLLNE